MLTLTHIRNWLTEKMPELSGKIALGGIDGNQRYFVGVYDQKSTAKQRICIGGPEQTRYQEKKATILVHWGGPAEAEEMAQKIHSLFYGAVHVEMGGVLVYMADPGGCPIFVGRDDRGISEYVVQVTLLYSVLPAAGTKTRNGSTY